ncbi:aminopeptidase [Fusibacter sp. 3D3]|uniref:aminopeptidase n=1 Tax=Fusibacter sp. 3D3 TaxID=1048380 RepID=UPI00085397F3|nr:aminopeptidase [Fusibacter sp. 3D3]GAU79636.1 hypothetical protein F3D3_4300 [Fusibacter sp. 3D3]
MAEQLRTNYSTLCKQLESQITAFEKKEGSQSEIESYFKASFSFLLKLIQKEKHSKKVYYEEQSLEALMAENHSYYHELKPEAYKVSYANPVYMTSVFGKDLGQRLCYVYACIRDGIIPAYQSDQSFLLDLIHFVFTVYENFMNMDDEQAISESIIAKLDQNIREYRCNNLEMQISKYFENAFTLKNLYNTEITKSAATSADLKDLFRYGVYISDYELKTASFIKAYPEEKLDKIAKSIVTAYVTGFKRDNKDIALRHQVRIVANAGQEKMTERILNHLKINHLNGFVSAVATTRMDQQYEFDHKFDIGLYLDDEVNKLRINAFKEGGNRYEAELRDYSGILFIEKFGEEPFSPESNESRLKLTELQQKLQQDEHQERSKILEAYVSETERSFCIVAFPSPEIGDQFEAIFEDIIDINMQDNDKVEKIQQTLIEALDQGEFVHVKGMNTNKTDILVKMHPLTSPEKQTNFVNCIADVNVPAGEVFTSPLLKGTNGILHVDTVYLEGFRFLDLELEFKDGEITNYTCKNFDLEDQNRAYIEENLLFPHKSLPMGEFAIGTNTLAYVISEKYGIVDKLPILIVEKMGPHFAIGDTCFAWAEDHPVFNPLDGKEIIARDNERVRLRAEDVDKAYTNCHIDITIPYDDIGEIAVRKSDGTEIALIKEGRFVLEGTEALNAPFQDLDS